MCRTSRFLRSPSSLSSPSLIMSSTPLTEEGCIGRTAPSVFLAILCTCVTEESELSAAGVLTLRRRELSSYLSVIVEQLELPRVRHRDLRPDRHPDAGVQPHKIPLGEDIGGENVATEKTDLFKKMSWTLMCT